jgi:hypothetical protein
MFLIWNLVYLSLASAVMLVIFNVPQVRRVIRIGVLATKGKTEHEVMLWAKTKLRHSD